ncbi:hypothetical protein PRZ48_006660 [Zasmidium cellare]|uniref:Alpha/beta hydrolase fold-3 domain-containing protein n=1 Tax=Zasmidium cellare TaxID=395010 RepID=A0ABR0EP04_ZASCE|nr:hypothetical protein PRZ48_006660 [Zasmidium cellare]
MADFSEYGHLTQQFLELQKTLPTSLKPGLEDAKKSTNDGREKASREEMQTLASQVVLQDYHIPTRDNVALEARTCRAKSMPAESQAPLYIHLHGGGFFFGTLDSEHANCSRVAIGAPVVVLNVNYRHTPEIAYPTPFNDAEDAFEWAYAHFEALGFDRKRIIVGGISAGSWILSSLVQGKETRRTPSSNSIIGQILMAPPTIHYDHYDSHIHRLANPEVSSYVQNKDAPTLSKAAIDRYNNLLFPSGASDDRRTNPGNATAEEAKGLPPAVFGICGADPLRDEGLMYAQLLASSGVPTNVHVYKGLPHGFRRRFGARLQEACDAWDATITEGIRWILSEPEATEEIQIKVH